MSDDEKFVFVLCALVALICWGRWFLMAASGKNAGASQRVRALLVATPVIAAALVFFILRNFSAADVRHSTAYTWFYETMGAAWVGLCTLLFPFFGLSVRDDVIERRNVVAAIAISGAVLGMAACYAGANVGTGPGWWVVIFCAWLSTCGLLLLWLMSEGVTRISEAITIDRDHAAGIRLGALLAAAGIVLGRAVAGDWHSASATLSDLVRIGWPAILLFGMAAVIETSCRPTPQSPRRSMAACGVVPAGFYLSVAALWIGYTGWPT